MSFENAMRASGLQPGSVIADGKWRRCKTDDKPRHRNGAYILHPDGRGFWRNWAVDVELNTWTDEGMHRAAQQDPAIAQRQRDADRKRRIEGMHRARALWSGGQPLRRMHPYIEAKGLQALGCTALRQHRDLLLVPLWQGQHLLNVQTIGPNGEKKFVYGAPTKGGYMVLDRPRAAVTALVEGLATGLAVYQCVRQARVIVAFNTGNLIPVVEYLKPSGSVVMCGDDDRGTFARRGFNPGRDAARNVADLIGCGVAFPVDIEGTDFADSLKEYGEGGPRMIERQILAQARYVSLTVP
jgi:putative DNA primase/helicase